MVLATAAPAAARPAAGLCDITYIPYQGGNQFSVSIAIGNTSTDYHIDGWTLRFIAPPGQTVLPETAFGVRLVQVGQEVTGTNLHYNPLLDPGNRLWVGFDVKGPDYRAEPTEFWVNDHACSVDSW